MRASAARGTLEWPETFYSGGTVSQSAIARPDQPDEIFDWWVHTPEVQSRPAPEAQTLTRAVLKYTDLSHRKLAEVLKTSHPTIAALEQGRSEARANDLFDRLAEMYEVTKRLFLIADRDASKVERLLTSPSESGLTAIDLLSDRRPAEAYLVALETNYPHRDGLMMQSVWPAKAGEATIDLALGPT